MAINGLIKPYTRASFSYRGALGMRFSFIIHQTHYEKSDWSRAFNQFAIACKLDMINAISTADVKFNVCLVTKPFGVFSSETTWLNASLLFLRTNYVKHV